MPIPCKPILRIVMNSGTGIFGKRVAVGQNAKEGTIGKPGAKFTKYLTTILRLSYDNAQHTIDLRQMSNLQNILR